MEQQFARSETAGVMEAELRQQLKVLDASIAKGTQKPTKVSVAAFAPRPAPRLTLLPLSTRQAVRKKKPSTAAARKKAARASKAVGEAAETLNLDDFEVQPASTCVSTPTYTHMHTTHAAWLPPCSATARCLLVAHR